MALILLDEYPGRVDPVNPVYPVGSFKNQTAPGTNDGTPLDDRWSNDWLGFSDALLALGQVSADGSIDSATASQRLEALRKIIGTERYYTTKALAAANINAGVTRLVIGNLNDAPFERIASGDPAEEKFEDANGQFWGVVGSAYFETQRERWNVDQLSNLPVFDDFSSTAPGYITNQGVRSYALSIPEYNIARAEVDDLQVEISTVAGTGDVAFTEGSTPNSVTATSPRSGKLVMTSSITGRISTGTTSTMTVTLDGVGTSGTVLQGNISSNGNPTLTAFAEAIIFAPAGTEITRTSSITFGPNGVWADLYHVTTLIPA